MLTILLVVLSTIVVAGMVYGIMYAVIVPVAYLCGRSGYTRQNLNWFTVLVVGDPPFWRIPARRRDTGDGYRPASRESPSPNRSSRSPRDPPFWKLPERRRESSATALSETKEPFAQNQPLPRVEKASRSFARFPSV